MDLSLTIKPRSDDALVASYVCPCGCTPRVTYDRGTDHIVDGCCCGNEFAIGPKAADHLHPEEGFVLEAQPFQAPWGEPLQAAWTIGQSAHQEEGAGDHDHGSHEDHAHDHGDAAGPATAIDPVCGMTVDVAAAREKGLTLRDAEVDYAFCGKGCKLEFNDDPVRYLDPAYLPSM